MKHKSNLTTQSDILIIGAGPAGLMAAISAAEKGKTAIILEQLSRPGLKLAATGGGRCNLTNMLDAESFMSRFGRQGRFMQPALALMDNSGLRDFFARHDVQTISPDGVLVYPASGSALTVKQALVDTCKTLGVRTVTGARAVNLSISDGRAVGVETESAAFAASAVILACGGATYPKLGGTGGGYPLARQAGHQIVEPLSVLAPVITKEEWPGRCTGISIADTRLWIDLPGRMRVESRGDVLFTHKGLSGPAVLNLSRDIAPLLTKQHEVPLRVTLTPGLGANDWLLRFDEWQRDHGQRFVRNLLSEHMPATLAAVIIELAGIPENRQAARFDKEKRRALADLLTGAPLTANATGGRDDAMVTRGGVSLREVDPRTLQSKLIHGLYFAGELLDLDGPCGGFNLQWAFSSGRLAGKSAATAS